MKARNNWKKEYHNLLNQYNQMHMTSQETVKILRKRLEEVAFENNELHNQIRKLNENL